VVGYLFNFGQILSKKVYTLSQSRDSRPEKGTVFTPAKNGKGIKVQILKTVPQLPGLSVLEKKQSDEVRYS
jgi:hypothetical protein